MSDQKSKAAKQKSSFSTVRLLAWKVWEGPEYISWQEDLEPHGGWPVLSLEITAADKDQIDSRIIYADLFDETQNSAILRAVYWDGVSARKAVRTEGEDFIPIIPAKLVHFDVQELEAWLTELNGIEILIPGKCERVSTEDIKKLRTSVDYKSCTFELVWQSNEERLDVLNNKWKSIWQKMSEALKRGADVVEFNEDYWFAETRSRYDFNVYDIDRV